MLEILNFPKERFLYLIPYTPIKYTLYSLPIYNLRYPIFKYRKTRSHTDGFQRNNAKCLDEKGISRFVPHSSI